eukprot:TRINITY_DN50263_c0_g1_i1.p1 TRINITY_DN50263_c0_g1~~TRINITY_DN50263_c0_g1_i1.p1  ORF type:complete len:207 (+),score=36.76 TRINITY_DN50263_c0_g1_i1:50-670(+)
MSFIGDLADRVQVEPPERYLYRFGYRIREDEPVVSLQVKGHDEENGHTMYEIHCSVSWYFKAAPLDVQMRRWTYRARLAELRAKLHDPIKQELPKLYAKHFYDTPFAHHGGVTGTTARLRAWFDTLARVANQGEFTPEILCMIFRCMQASVPEFSDDELAAEFGRCKTCALHTGLPDITKCGDCEELRQRARYKLQQRRHIEVTNL